MSHIRPRESVQMFAALMETKLRERDDERSDTWLISSTEEYLLDRLGQEIDELRHVIEEGGHPTSVVLDNVELLRECADVANFAMFIAMRRTILEAKNDPVKMIEAWVRVLS